MFNLFNKKRVEDDCYCSVIVVAAGESIRMNSEKSKPLIEILNKPVIAYALEQFESSQLIKNIIIVSKEEDIIEFSSIIEQYGFSKVSKIVVGGKERYNSVYNGIKELDERTNIVLIHDGARPIVSIEVMEDAIFECIEKKAVVIGVKVKDTIKVVSQEGIVIETPKRENLWIAQTPQIFDYSLITNVYKRVIEDELDETDDSSFVEKFGYKVTMFEGKYDNIKITTEDDLAMVEGLLQSEGYYN